MPIYENGYESYPQTKYVDGNKKFGELVEGDKVYILDSLTKDVNTYNVKKPICVHDGHLVLFLCGHKHIDFGPDNVQNVRDAVNMSICFIGTFNTAGTDANTLFDLEIANNVRKVHELNKIVEQLIEARERFNTVQPIAEIGDTVECYVIKKEYRPDTEKPIECTVLQRLNTRLRDSWGWLYYVESKGSGGKFYVEQQDIAKVHGK
jgi:hypothetical protein